MLFSALGYNAQYLVQLTFHDEYKASNFVPKRFVSSSTAFFAVFSSAILGAVPLFDKRLDPRIVLGEINCVSIRLCYSAATIIAQQPHQRFSKFKSFEHGWLVPAPMDSHSDRTETRVMLAL